MKMYNDFFCIYNKELANEYMRKSGDSDSTISDFVTPYNIVPTMLDLFGFTYNENLFLGSSIFDNKDDVFHSIKLSGFFNDDIYSDDGITLDNYAKEYMFDELKNFQANCAII